MHNYTVHIQKIFILELPQEFILQILKANIRDSIDKYYTFQFDNYGKFYSLINEINFKGLSSFK